MLNTIILSNDDDMNAPSVGLAWSSIPEGSLEIQPYPGPLQTQHASLPATWSLLLLIQLTECWQALQQQENH